MKPSGFQWGLGLSPTLEADSGDVPMYLLLKLREIRNDVWPDGALWRRYWLKRLVAIDSFEF